MNLPPFAEEESDAKVLRNIAEWLDTSYRKKIMISGMIYLQYIDEEFHLDNFWDDNLDLFKRITQSRTDLSSVALATTGWSSPRISQSRKSAERSRANERGLMKREVWGELIGRGAKYFQYAGDEIRGNRESALKVIDHLLQHQKKDPLQIQDEMVNQGLNLNQTEVGRYVRDKIQREWTERERELGDTIEADIKYLTSEEDDEFRRYRGQMEEEEAESGNKGKWRKQKQENLVAAYRDVGAIMQKAKVDVLTLDYVSGTRQEEQERSKPEEDISNGLSEPAQYETSRTGEENETEG